MSSDCSELAHPVLVAHKCSSVLSVLPNPSSSSQFTCHLPRGSLVPGIQTHTTSPTQASPPRLLLFRSMSKGVLPSARTWYLQKIQQQCRIIQLMKGWSVSSLQLSFQSRAASLCATSLPRSGLLFPCLPWSRGFPLANAPPEFSVGVSPALHGE